MIEENVQCVATALRNSILTLGKIPEWILLDNGKAFKAKIFTEDIRFENTELPGMLARLSEKAGHPVNYHFAQHYNAQAKPIERIFGILNEQLERLIPSYIGASIEDKPAWTKRNEKLAQSLHNPYVPTIEEANELIRAWRDRYAERPSRGRDGLRPTDIFEQGKGPGVDPNELIYLMMDYEIKNIHRNGVTWLGWHWYDEALYGLKDKVIIKYSLSDLSQIYIFHKNEFLCTAKPIEPVHPMASESENPKDMEAVKEVFRLKKRVKNTTRKLCDLLDSKAASDIDWSRTKRPEISETIQKIEEAKKPKAKFISPFGDDDDQIHCDLMSKTPDEYAVIFDSNSPFSYPEGGYLTEYYEIYNWYKKIEKKFPGRLKNMDWCRIADYETTLEWKIYFGKGGDRANDCKMQEIWEDRERIMSRTSEISERPWLKDWLENDHEKYIRLIEQGSLTPDNWDFIQKFREKSPLYKAINFDDDKEIEARIRHEGSNQ